MRRWVALLVLLVLGLTLALHADAAVSGVDATAALSDAGGGNYRLTIANIGSTTIGSVVFTAGPALKISSVVSTMTSNSIGACALSGSSGIACNVALAPPPCTCMPGDQLEVTFAATGDAGGSKAVIDNAKTFPFGTAATTPPTTPPTPPTTPPATPPAAMQKLSARVGPGSHVTFAHSAKAGKTQITVRDLSASDNFHLSGPGVNKKTGVGFKGTVTWTLTLKHGTYAFRSDSHAKLRGTTKVA